MKKEHLLYAALSVVVAGCGGDITEPPVRPVSTAPPEPVATRIEINKEGLDIHWNLSVSPLPFVKFVWLDPPNFNDRVQLTASVLDQSGVRIASAGVKWVSRDPAIAFLTDTLGIVGTIRARMYGRTVVVAEAVDAPITDSVTVIVNRPPVANLDFRFEEPCQPAGEAFCRLVLSVGEEREIDLSGRFVDPDGGKVTYPEDTDRPYDTTVVQASFPGAKLVITGLAEGGTDVTYRPHDDLHPTRLVGDQYVRVTVTAPDTDR